MIRLATASMIAALSGCLFEKPSFEWSEIWGRLELSGFPYGKVEVVAIGNSGETMRTAADGEGGFVISPLGEKEVFTVIIHETGASLDAAPRHILAFNSGPDGGLSTRIPIARPSTVITLGEVRAGEEARAVGFELNGLGADGKDAGEQEAGAEGESQPECRGEAGGRKTICVDIDGDGVEDAPAAMPEQNLLRQIDSDGDGIDDYLDDDDDGDGVPDANDTEFDFR